MFWEKNDIRANWYRTQQKKNGGAQMIFNEFINKLNKKDGESFYKYPIIRGVHSYKIIYYSLNRISDNVSYQDVNSFIKYDKTYQTH